MKLKIFDGLEERPPVMLRLIGNSRAVTVCVVDMDGEVVSGGNLITLLSEGIFFHSDINREFGFNLDSQGEIEITRRLPE